MTNQSIIWYFSGCSKEVRAQFNEKLVKFLSEEFMEYVQRSSPTSAEKVQGNTNLDCLNVVVQYSSGLGVWTKISAMLCF